MNQVNFLSTKKQILNKKRNFNFRQFIGILFSMNFDVLRLKLESLTIS